MKKKIVLVITAIALAVPVPADPVSAAFSLDKRDRAYLETIMRETWNYLDGHRADETGFPSDSQTGRGNTNTTNIGLYLASVGPAYQLGYISRDQALQRIRKIIASVNRLEGCRGFLPNWVDIGGKTAIAEPVLAVSDFNKLITGLILVRQFFPEIFDEAASIIDRVEWDRLYHSQTGNTYWGYDLKNDRPVGPGRFFLASDCRLVVFYMVASNAVPAEVWDHTHRHELHADGLTFFEPGYHLGGLFMQAIDAIFLPDLTTDMGCSIADLAWHQIRMAKQKTLPAWGWSNCNIPGKGYTEGGFLPWWVVTPHASALVIEFYPRHVIANLRQLESMGLRKPFINETPYGFRDSIDLKTGHIDNRYLCLDQAMLFLALVNYTQNQMLRNVFAKDPLVQNGLKQLAHYFAPDPQKLHLWRQRDASEPKPVTLLSHLPKEITLDFTQDDEFELSKNAWGSATIQTKQTSEGLIADFDLRKEDPCEAEIRLYFPPIDAGSLKNIEITCSAISANTFGGIRVYLFDDQGQSQYAYVDNITSRMQIFSISSPDRLGILVRPQVVNSLAIKLWKTPWYYHHQATTAETGRLIIQKIHLE